MTLNTGREPSPQRGASTVGIAITLVILGVAGVGGYWVYCYYKVLDLKHELPKALDKVHMFRGVGGVTEAKIRAKTLTMLRQKGGTLDAGAVGIRMVSLNTTNSAQLPAMQRQKLSLACYVKRIDKIRDVRIENAKRVLSGGMAKPIAVPSSKPPPIKPGGKVTCPAERLEELDYTFVEVTATATVKKGWVKRVVKVSRRFYLPQPPPDAAGGEDDDDDDDDENEDEDEDDDE